MEQRYYRLTNLLLNSLPLHGIPKLHRARRRADGKDQGSQQRSSTCASQQRPHRWLVNELFAWFLAGVHHHFMPDQGRKTPESYGRNDTLVIDDSSKCRRTGGEQRNSPNRLESAAAIRRTRQVMRQSWTQRRSSQPSTLQDT